MFVGDERVLARSEQLRVAVCLDTERECSKIYILCGWKINKEKRLKREQDGDGAVTGE